MKFSFVHQGGNNDSRLSFYITTKSPTQKSYLVLERNSYFGADSWMEITVGKTKTPRNHTKLVEELYFTETVTFNTSMAMARLFISRSSELILVCPVSVSAHPVLGDMDIV